MSQFNIIVEDAWGRIFHQCPRCFSDWVQDNGNVHCSGGCLMAVAAYTAPKIPNKMTTRKDSSAHILFLILDQCMVQWWEDCCRIFTLNIETGIIGGNSIKTEFLPYDVTEEQVKLYLTFS